jgi:Mrp family chromosome partitioning ATPase
LLRRLPGGRPVDLTAEGTRHPTVAESYRSLASRLLVLGATDTMRSVMIASPAPGEGRSSVSANLAASLVDLGYRVWLVSADLRPPQVHRLFGMHDEPDLVDVVPMDSERVQGRNSSSLVVRAHADREGGYGHLTLVSEPDRRPIGAGRLISPLALVRLVEENQHVADLTIIDAPPLLEYADAVPLLPRVDAVIVVADAGLTRRSDLEELTDLLGGTRARVVGAVLNRDGSRTTTRRSRRARARLDQRNRPMRRTRGTEASSRAPSPSAEPPVAEPPVAEPVADRSDDHLAEGSSERVDAAPPNGDRGADPGNQAGAGEERLRGVFVPSVRVTAVGWPEPPITHSRGAEETPTNVGWS